MHILHIFNYYVFLFINLLFLIQIEKKIFSFRGASVCCRNYRAGVVNN